jgi:hypothetical protein
MEYRFHGGQTSLPQKLHFLQAKLFCLDSYRFADEQLEARRLVKCAETQQDLALRLLENGKVKQGRTLLQESLQVLGNSRRARLGLISSYFPHSWQQFILGIFRRFRPRSYTDKVRSKEK